MSALPPKADIRFRDRHVRFVPKADMTADLRANGDLQDLREIGLVRLKLLAAVRRIADRLAHAPRRSRYGRFQTNPPFQTTSVGVHGCPTPLEPPELQ
jgi:hypothetical protein